MRPAWVTRQIAAFVAQFCDPSFDNLPWIGIQTLAGFRGQPEDGLFRRGGRMEPCPDLPVAEGFVWRPNDPKGVPELWLAPTKTGYRAAFERFARRELQAPGLDGADVQIDHVFPKKAADLGDLGYVRMLAVPPESNMAAGRTLEKAMVARNEEMGARGKPTRLATYASIGKATGFAGYDAIPDDGPGGNSALANALMAHLRKVGLPPAVLTAFDAKMLADRMGTLR